MLKLVISVIIIVSLHTFELSLYLCWVFLKNIYTLLLMALYFWFLLQMRSSRRFACIHAERGARSWMYLHDQIKVMHGFHQICPIKWISCILLQEILLNSQVFLHFYLSTCWNGISQNLHSLIILQLVWGFNFEVLLSNNHFL